MPRFKEPEPLEDEFKPTMRDVSDMNNKLEKYSPIKIGGRTQYPFDQYLNDEEVIRFDDFGGIIIRKPGEYQRLSDINRLREWKRDKDLLEVLATMPEEKAAHESKIEKIRVQIRALLKGTQNVFNP